MIDLHTHTTESDGTLTPAELIAAAADAGLEALAITDHDTFRGFDLAVPEARAAGLDLLPGIELSTRHPIPGARRPRSIHVLGYFPDAPVPPPFLAWIGRLQEDRRDRNRRLSARLAELGLDVPVSEAEALGRNVTGRPHFARVMVARGYVASIQQAFDEYLDESAKGYVTRDEPSTVDGIRRMREAGGLAVIAHPIRLGGGDPALEKKLLGDLCGAGLDGLEVYHSDHDPAATARYEGFARHFGLLSTGGSDFHGLAKSGIRLGVGRGDLDVPKALFDALRERLTPPRL